MKKRRIILLLILLCVSVWWIQQIDDYRKRREKQDEIILAKEDFNRLFRNFPRFNSVATSIELSAQCVERRNFQRYLCSNALVIDLGTPGLSVTSMPTKTYTYWNIDNDDFAEYTSWIGTEDGFLAMDKNNDGIINSHNELFGTPGHNGITILRSYDEDGNKQINAKDPIYKSLLIWQDTNGDGISQHSEIRKLSDYQIQAISTESRKLAYMQNSHLILGELNALSPTNPQRNIYALRLDYDNANSRYIKPYYIDNAMQALVQKLPYLDGWGDLPDLHTAMCVNSKLLAMVTDLHRQDIATLLSPSYAVSQKVEDIMFEWANVADMPQHCRGGLVSDDRKLIYLERYTGKNFIENGTETNPNPSLQSAIGIDHKFKRQHQIVLLGFLRQSALNKLTQADWVNPNTGKTEPVQRLNLPLLAQIQAIAASSSDPFYVWQLIVLMTCQNVDLRTQPDLVHALNNAIKATIADKNLLDVMASLDYGTGS